jgi:hypothetical protein
MPLNPHEMQTYSVSTPPGLEKDFYRRVTCEEAECASQQYGWETLIDETIPLGQRQAWYIRNQAGRKYTEIRTPTGTTFRFAPDQPCFMEHKIRTGRPELYVVRGGDQRGNPLGTRTVHSGPDAWLDDFQTNQQTIRDAQERG